MLNCAEQGQIQKYKTHAYKTLKTAGMEAIMLKHPTKQLKNKQINKQRKHIKPKYRINVDINDPNHTN